MYSNQSPQTAYQQFYNNMPSYPQNNQPLPDKQPMVEKYPLQIWVAALRKQEQQLRHQDLRC